jgi:glutathione S-transferase
MADVVLWHFPISHFNEKVRWALDWKRIAHHRRALVWSYPLRALWATGQPRLPILFLEGRAIADSTRIIEALERFQPEPALYPRDDSARRRALELEDFFDEEVGHALRAAVMGPLLARNPREVIAAFSIGVGTGTRLALRLLYPLFREIGRARHNITPATIKAGRAKVLAGLDRLEAELGPSGYLVGDRFSIADLTAASIFSRLVFPPEYPYQVGPLPAWLLEYQSALAGRAGYQWVAEMYRRHRGNSAEILSPAAAPGRVGLEAGGR